jgi:hypothetical protein
MLITMSACDRHPERHINAAAIDVTEVWSSRTGIGGRPLGSVTGMAAGPRGSIWVTDGSNHMVLSYPRSVATDGAPVETATGFPWDIPWLVTPESDGGMAILDVRYNAIVMTDSMGTVVDSAKMQVVMMSPKGFAAGPSGSFYVSAGTFLTNRAIFEYDRSGSVIRAWHPIPRAPDFSNRSMSNARLVAGGPLTVQPDGTILYADAAPHRLMKFPPGDTVGVVIASDSQLVGPIVDEFEVKGAQNNGTSGAAQRWNFAQTTGLYALPSGTLVNVVTFGEEGRSVWELYEDNGSLLGRREIDVPYHAWGLTPDGDVLVSIRPMGVDTSRVARVRVTYRPHATDE